ncbi:hypothetical protein BC628DRAFT_1533941 [Trametes gibbosa]|nr:hypothetical protein BC628DRAFT_1533941 [Trametes gibbosa]
MQFLDVNDEGMQLSYIDSGIPPGDTVSKDYTTIFAVHGMCFTSPTFERVMALASPAKVRFVAINRRDYPGSTPLSPDDISTLASGSDQEKAALLKARGVELATFVSRFVEHHSLPPISEDGQRGGFALLSWSLGNATAMSAVANIDKLSSAAQARWASGMRALILQEPPTGALGTPLPPKAWTPQIDTTVPAELRDPFFTQWITSYFTHGDLSTRSLDVLSYVIPSTSRVPSIFNMSAEQISSTIHYGQAATSDMLFMVYSAAQANANYKKACFDANVRQLLPRMKISVLMGEKTCSFSVIGSWAIEDDDKARGGGFINFRLVPGANHLMHWDDPALALKVYTESF